LTDFCDSLIAWYCENKRDLPWRRTRDPYHIWVSEIILQQTRVESGLGYYERFLKRFPGLSSLASAEIGDVLKVWQGMGYYTRARNMHETARVLMDRHQGQFPEDYHELRKLKGIGDYTAAAIASFSFGKAHPVLDGNAFRVLSRFFAVEHPIDSSQGKKVFLDLASKLIDRNRPDLFNQAIMEFGALICVPGNPDCLSCPLMQDCQAVKKGIVHFLPQKKRKKPPRNRYFHYLQFVLPGGYTIVRQRKQKDIWHSLYEFPLIEADQRIPSGSILSNPDFQELYGSYHPELTLSSGEYVHVLSHQRIHAWFFQFTVAGDMNLDAGFEKVHVDDFQASLPTHRLMQRYLNNMDQ
jgi:A/G-specific adenine glycosylase